MKDIIGKIDRAAQKKGIKMLTNAANVTDLTSNAKVAARTSNSLSSIKKLDMVDDILKQVAVAATSGNYVLKISKLDLASINKLVKNLTSRNYAVAVAKYSSDYDLLIMWYGKKYLRNSRGNIKSANLELESKSILDNLYEDMGKLNAKVLTLYTKSDHRGVPIKFQGAFPDFSDYSTIKDSPYMRQIENLSKVIMSLP